MFGQFSMSVRFLSPFILAAWLHEKKGRNEMQIYFTAGEKGKRMRDSRFLPSSLELLHDVRVFLWPGS